jgi:uncharacterized protein YecT (DUF1311 family)
MRHMLFAITLLCLLVAIFAMTFAPTRPAAAGEPHYPNPAHAQSGSVPANLVTAVAKTCQIDEVAVRDAAVVGCVGHKPPGCYIGANLDCYTADARRALPGATDWYREYPGSSDIHVYVTGRGAIYGWSCKGRRAVAGQAVRAVDPQGYVAENWKEILVSGSPEQIGPITALHASAQPSAEFDACMAQADTVSSKMLDCGKAEIDKWDARLNAAYQTLLHRSEGKERAQLQREQRAWLKHHLSETHRLAVDPNNGSVAFLESQAFELQDLSDRTLALEKRVRYAP